MIDPEQVVLTARSRIGGVPELEGKVVWENEDSDAAGLGSDDFQVDEEFNHFATVPIGTGYDRLTGELRFTVSVPRGKAREANTARESSAPGVLPGSVGQRKRYHPR